PAGLTQQATDAIRCRISLIIATLAVVWRTIPIRGMEDQRSINGENSSGHSVDRVPTSLDDVLRTAELARRPTRSRDYAAENQALTALAGAMADSPQTILQKLVETALGLCRADSAGISILEPGGTTGVFRWYAVAGRFASKVGSHV